MEVCCINPARHLWSRRCRSPWQSKFRIFRVTSMFLTNVGDKFGILVTDQVTNITMSLTSLLPWLFFARTGQARINLRKENHPKCILPILWKIGWNWFGFSVNITEREHEKKDYSYQWIEQDTNSSFWFPDEVHRIISTSFEISYKATQIVTNIENQKSNN